MDAFESLIATLLNRQGYWTTTSFKVQLTKEEKRKMGIPSSPRWELDVLAYSGTRNELLVVECKSYLDSRGVRFKDRDFYHPTRYKLFTRPVVRETVLSRLKKQVAESGLCAKNPKITLALATGNIATEKDREELLKHSRIHNWELLDDNWIRDRLVEIKKSNYENDVVHVCAKILLRGKD